MKTHKNTRGKNLTKGDSALDFESACLFKAVIKRDIFPTSNAQTKNSLLMYKNNLYRTNQDYVINGVMREETQDTV